MSDCRRPTLVCLAGDDWDGNPHSRHHLARQFAREMNVLFVEGVPMRTVARGDGHEWRRLARKVKEKSGLRAVAPTLHVLRPLPVPPAGRVGRWAQLVNVKRQIDNALDHLSLGCPRIVWFSIPTLAPLLGRFDEALDVFFYQDRYDQFSHVQSERVRRHVAQLARECEVTIATSAPLAEDLRALGAEPRLASHGVDLAHFGNPGRMPADLSHLQAPLVGCVGLVDDYWDFDALLDIADRLDRGTVVLVGASNVSRSRFAHPRIVWLGRRSYDAIPDYMAAFHVCLIPFANTDLTRSVNPIKLREYLAVGRPVVATALPELVPYADVVELVSPDGDFVAAVARTLAEGYDSPTMRVRRQERVAAESWDSVAAKIEGWMNDALDRPVVSMG